MYASIQDYLVTLELNNFEDKKLSFGMPSLTIDFDPSFAYHCSK